MNWRESEEMDGNDWGRNLPGMDLEIIGIHEVVNGCQWMSMVARNLGTLKYPYNILQSLTKQRKRFQHFSTMTILHIPQPPASTELPDTSGGSSIRWSASARGATLHRMTWDGWIQGWTGHGLRDHWNSWGSQWNSMDVNGSQKLGNPYISLQSLTYPYHPQQNPL